MDLCWVVLLFAIATPCWLAAQISCPGNKLVVNDPSQCGAVLDDLMPTIDWAPNDFEELRFEIEGATIADGTGEASGEFFNIGLSTVTYTVLDAQLVALGSCTFTVQVLDFETPQNPHCGKTVVVREDALVISDPAGLIMLSEGVDECAGVALTLNPLAVTDNCLDGFSFSLVSSPDLANPLPVGSYPLQFAFEDPMGTTHGCELTLEVIPLPTFDILASPSNIGCEGDFLEIKPASVVQQADIDWIGPNNYESNDLSPDIEINATTAGEYELIYTTGNGCVASSSIELSYIPDPIISLASNSPICEGDLELSAQIEPNSTPVATWEWWGPCNFAEDGQSVVISNFDPDCAGEYGVSASNNIGCKTTETIQVETTALATPTLLSPCAASLCLDQQCELMGTEYAQEQVTYVWEFDEALLPLTSLEGHRVEFTGTTHGNFEVRYKVVIDGCSSDWASIEVVIPPAPEVVDDVYNLESSTGLYGQNVTANDLIHNDFTVNIVKSTDHGALVLNEDGSFDYTPNPGYIGDDTFMYRICQPCGQDDCDEGNVIINLSYSGNCEVPTVLTPNGDGKNDHLKIHCIDSQNLKDNQLTIYNLWGDIVFDAAPYENDWSGGLLHPTKNPLPDGTYFYVFRASEEEEADKGSITIIR